MKKRNSITILLLLSLLFTACEKNDIEKINFLNNDKDYPDIIGSDVEVLYSDSAKVKVKMYAPSLKQFNQAEKPHSEFSQGIKVEFFDDSLQLESDIQADYAIYYTDERLWHAKGNVIVKNIKTNERLDSEELFWNEEKEEIYSESFTKIVNENGTFYGENGFQSDQTLTDYTLIGSKKSIINIKEDE